MKTFNGIMNIEVEFEFTETHPAIGIGYDKSGQAIDPPAPPEWELEGFNIGNVEIGRGLAPQTSLINEVRDKIEQHIIDNYSELTK